MAVQNTQPSANADRDEALFRSLQRKKRARRRRVIRTVIIVVLLLAVGLTGAVLYLRRRVQRSVVSDHDVSSARAERGSVSTTVSGSGTLANVDEEDIKIPGGVVIDELIVKANERVKAGDVIAKLDKSSVLSAMETAQSDLESLDKEIFDARGDEMKNYITSGVEGTIHKVYAKMGDKVIDVMAEHGCLAEIMLANGQTIRVIGLAGTVYEVYAQEGAACWQASILFTLTDTWFSAKYDAWVQQRQEKEEQLLTLLKLSNDDALLAPYDGSISSVSYDEDTDYSGEDEFTVVTMSPDREMEVEISVDETNILSLELDQTASLTVSSIGDDTYYGRVTEISKTAASSSGVTRYSAVITLKKAEAMLPGMTARAVINISGVENALIVPVDALHQTSAKSFVYTSYDTETGSFGGLKEVEAGISNSDYVEILSGLEEGETVYYTKKEANPWASYGGGMSSGGYGGNMPSGGYGGNRPSGGYGGSRPSGGYGGGMPSGGMGGNRP